MVGKCVSASEDGGLLGPPVLIGSVALRNRVILAPMSGITDAPFRRLAERLGAGLVVSEMTACAGLVRGEREAVVRSEGKGVGIHVVQLAACDAHWIAEGARIADALVALTTFGGDAIMIGRAAQGRPWFPGQVARYLASGRLEPTPPIGEQFKLIDALYEEMLDHHGKAIGRRHARKHLGWALDSAAVSAKAPIQILKSHRSRVLTANEPAHARRLLAEAFDEFAWRAAA